MIRESAERLTGLSVMPVPERHRLQESEQELRGKQRELQDLAYSILDYTSGSPQEMKAQERRRLAQRARVVWQQDPQYGGTINLMNEFVLGRGVPKPQAVDEAVQDEIDEFWTDPDNMRILTTHAAQVRLNTDLSLQSNVFPLVYDEGEDGQVKLGLIDHDTVEQAVRDPDMRLRILYYFTKSYSREWDVEKHAYVVSKERSKIRYYEEFRNVQDAERDVEEGLRKEELPDIPDELKGRGRVLHVAVNRTTEQAFGIPEIARVLRWMTAYNDLMRARVDMAKAAASIIMRRKMKGGAAAMQQLASQALMQTGAVPNTPTDPTALGQAPRPASIIEENDYVEHSAFTLNSGSASAMQDGQMIRSQYSVGTGWPQSYLGDPSATDLSTATTLELRVLKMVEARQQVLEDLITTLVNHKIRRAVETQKLSTTRPLTAEEKKREAMREAAERGDEAAAAGGGVPGLPGIMPQPPAGAPAEPAPTRSVTQANAGGLKALHLIGDEYDADDVPHGQTIRDFSFQVQMPSPLRRAMGDLINGVSIIAKTFDPNASNMELSRTLLGIALGEGLEVEDPGAAVERIFPPGYVDPMVAAAQQQAAMQQQPQFAEGEGPEGMGQPAPFGAFGGDNQFHPPGNPYGAKQAAQPPEVSMQQAAVSDYEDAIADRRIVMLHARGGPDGAPLPLPREVQEAIVKRAVARMVPTPNGRARAVRLGVDRAREADLLADGILGPAIAQALTRVAQAV